MLQLLKPGQVWFAWFPFAENQNKGKDRPILVLDVENDHVSVWGMKITKSAPHDRDDFVLSDWQDIPLPRQSTISPKNVFKIHIRQLRRYVGMLSERDWNRTMEAIEALYH